MHRREGQSAYAVGREEMDEVRERGENRQQAFGSRGRGGGRCATGHRPSQ